MNTTVFLTDLHCPYEDTKAVGICFQIITDLQPNRIIVGGDSADFYSISSFSRDPKRVLKLQGELDQTFKIHKQIDELSDAEVIFIPGNHEARLERYLRLRPELHGLDTLKLESLLRLDELGWTLKPEVRDNNLLYIHGKYVSKHSAYSIKRELEARAYQISILMGHTHRQGHFAVTGYKSTVDGYEVGCLCKDQEYSYVSNWQRGFAVVTDGFVELVSIRKGKVIFRGKEYK